MFGRCVAEFETSLPAGRAGEGSQVDSGAFSNFKTCAHVGQADMGQRLIGPLLACPAGADVLMLANVFPRHRLPGWLVQPEGKSLKLRFLPVEPARGVRLIRFRLLTSKLVLMSDKPTWGGEQKVNLEPRRSLHRPSCLTHPETRV